MNGNTCPGDLSPRYPRGLYGGRMRLVPPGQRHGIGGKIVGRANTGQPGYVGIALPDTRHHLHILGPTGTGKSTLMLNMILDDCAAGRGTAVFDPKGDLINDLLDRLPAECGDRLILIDPAEIDAPPALNLLDPVHGTPHQVAAHVTAVMGQVWSRWWGHRTADIAHHALLTLAHLPGATLGQLPRLLSDGDWRAETVEKVKGIAARRDPWQVQTLAEFWRAYEQGSDASRAAAVAPLLAKLRLVLAHPLAAALFGVPSTTFRLPDVLRGAILLVRLPKGIVGEDGCRLIGSLLLAGLWQATAARAGVPEHQRLDASIWADECHNFLHLPIGLEDALAEARGLRVSFALAHQYLGQLPDSMAAAIDSNARNKIYFALAPDDAHRLQRHVAPFLDESDLIRQGGFEVVLRPVAGGKAIPPVTADTLPPPGAAKDRAGQLRHTARALCGLPAEARHQLLLDTKSAAPSASMADAASDSATGLGSPAVKGFTKRPAAESLTDPLADPLAPRLVSEPATQPATPGTSSPQVNPSQQEPSCVRD